MGKLTFGAECLEQLQNRKRGRTSSYHSFHWSSWVQSSCSFLQSTDAVSVKQSKMKPDEVLALVTDLKESLEELHKKVETSSGADRPRSRRKSEKLVKANFDLRDYVLVGTTQFGTQAKTDPRSIGPFRVVTALSQCVYAVEHISTKKRQEVHVNALRFYHDPSLNVKLSVEEQLAFDEARVYEVERLRTCKRKERSGCCA